jgi:hypothetical protein
MNVSNNPIDLITKLSDLHNEIHEVLQDTFFDTFAMSKRAGFNRKVASGLFNHIKYVHLGEHLIKSQPLTAGQEFIPLPVNFLLEPNLEFEPGSILLITNNDIGGNLSGYIDFYNRSPHVLVIIWDWDTQHWIQMSAMLGMHCDFYIPAGSENSFLLTHFNPCFIGPIFAGVHQWSRRFIAENFGCLLETRKNEPFGPHAFYGKYQRRNRAIATVTKAFPSINFSNNEYRNKSDIENLREWGSYKTHWIVPILGGVPIRVYNALAVGGIPIVPSFYRNMPEVALLGDIPLYYDVSDLIDPYAINQQAIEKFDSAGESGVVERVSFGLENLHIDHRCEQILTAAQKFISRTIDGNYDYKDGYCGLED